MKKIFLSYRREDSADVTGRIFDHLERRFGRDRLFLDVDTIRYGDDFRHRIGQALDQTGVLLAIIGDRWVDAPDPTAPAGRRRLDDPNDYVRTEISSALERGITIVPVLVGDAQMPGAADLPGALSELAYRNAADIRSGRDFPFQVNRLIETIAELLGQPLSEPVAPPVNISPPPRLAISSAELERNPTALAGTQLRGLVIERLLATGGSGIAYLASNPRTGQHVCVKVSLPVLSDMEGIRRALGRGVRGLVALNHPYIARVHEFDALELVDARLFYVVLDYVDGVSFGDWTAALPPGREGLRRFLRMACLIARTLEAAHTCRYRDDAGFETVGVMHGDVKPGNILIREDDTPALMDFMMIDVHRAVDPEIRERLARRGETITTVFGTPGFMAPEQEREGIVTVRTDIYGLGVTLGTAAHGLSLPDDVRLLLDRMTGPPDGRPNDMDEVAHALSDSARRHGLETEEMSRDRSVKKAGRGVFSTIASLFRDR